MTRPIFFLTDFGLGDSYVGVVKAVILGIAPDAPVVDLTHDVPPQDVRAGAFALLTAVRYLPNDAIVLAVVDPGVGTERRPIAVQAGARVFVGPDNGLLSWAMAELGRPAPSPQPPGLTPKAGADKATEACCTHTPPCQNCQNDKTRPGRGEPAARPPEARASRLPIGGRLRGVVLDRPRFWLPTVSASFHGRDLFGPVAAHLARGVPLDEVGSAIRSIVALPFPTPVRDVDAAGATVRVRGEVIHVDRFGNLITTLRGGDLPRDPVVTVAGRRIVGLSPHFQSTAPLIAMIGSAGLLEIAVPNGSGAAVLDVGVGAAVEVRSSSADAPGRS